MIFSKNYFKFFALALVFAVISAEECGTLNDSADNHLPWQAGVYKNGKAKGGGRLLEWVCSASLLSDKVVLSAAHKLFIRLSKIRPLPAARYSAGVGAQPWPWREPEDLSTQYSQVIAIHLAPGFQHRGGGGGIEYYADDIAVVIVEKPFSLSATIKPVCLNFEYEFEVNQLSDGSVGKSPGWLYDYYDEEDEKPAYYQLVKNLHHVPLSECLDDDVTDKLDSASVKLLALAVSDKLCFGAGQNTSAPCTFEEEDGSGVSFPALVNGTSRYYLRGVLSGPIESAKDCTILTNYMFTSLLKHEGFIRKFVVTGVDKSPPPQTSKCILPPYPDHGTYTITATHMEAPGKEYSMETLTVTCEPGYGVIGTNRVSCFNGYWLQGFPKCVRMCILKPHPSVVHVCTTTDGECGLAVPPGTLVSVRCAEPNYRAPAPLPNMSCSEDGYWDYVARCVPDCGRVTPSGTELVVGGLPAKKGELPWHAGVYKKSYNPYMQVCGGSLISSHLVVSAAHCFWSNLEKQQPAEQFAVAVGKLYRAWDDPADDAQKSDVKAIHLPPRFQGSASNYQDDIAVLEVITSFQYRPHVRPVCLSFDSTFEKLQLQANNLGKVAGWGLTSANGSPSSVLRVVELPYVDVGTCIVESPPQFREYITSDKICAGFGALSTFGTLCKGDSGGGLSFPGAERGLERYYLRGVVSTAPNNEHACNTASFTSFTALNRHQDFIKQFLTDA